MSTIYFYKNDEPFGFLSNFSPHPILLDNEVWKTVEHYFQANKFLDNNVARKIKELDSPMKAASEGRNRRNIIRSDWEEIKEQVMLKALLAKFLQHPKLRKQLLMTDNNILVEHTANDNYWADGGDGTGRNRLGKLLMQVRDELKFYSEDVDIVLPPWIAFPKINQFDLFWRMGLGEEYITQWAKFYLKSDKEVYQRLFPENEDWEGIYD
ncbi:NADAR family protein [Sphingobacterium thalpophilum]|uniref:NADAR family protein n=1 Tax=Sphingobacterium thalpophilum TaxID=259 RepID=UPI002D781028|nr:NADAR family protein [Sphingobacterium thalpophilum]